MSSQERSAGHGMNNALVSALTAIAIVGGFAPMMLMYLHARWPLLILGATGALIIPLLRRRATPAGAERPTLIEILFAQVGAIGFSAWLAFTTLGWYWIVRFVVWLAALVVNQFGGHWAPSGPSISRTVTLIFAVLVGFGGSSLLAEGLSRQLFPDAAGVSSAYLRLIAQRRKQIMIGAAAAAIAVVVFLLVIGPGSRNLYLWITLFLFGVGMPLWTAADAASQPHRDTPIEKAVAKLFEAVGYSVTSQPRTGNAAIDPFLLTADLFAVKGRAAYLIAVKVRTDERPPATWTDASSVVSGAWALMQGQGESSLPVDSVVPVVVLVGKQADDALQHFATTQEVCLIHIARPGELTSIVDQGDQVRLQEYANQLLASLEDFRGAQMHSAASFAASATSQASSNATERRSADAP